MSQQLFVTGIGTDVGKTLVSSVLCKALKPCFYWKPVQAGSTPQTDSEFMQKLSPETEIRGERFLLLNPMSPHAAAKLENVEIKISDFVLPENGEKNLVIEGAGGILVPLNDKGETYAELLKEWKIPCVVVSKNYLGSINHTMLTIKYLESQNIEIFGVIFSGESNIETENYIKNQFKNHRYFNVPHLEDISANTIEKIAMDLKKQWKL